jgi:hypothetical protein
MLRAGTGHPAGQDLSALGDVLFQPGDILVIDFTLHAAECADFFLSADRHVLLGRIALIGSIESHRNTLLFRN